MPKTVPQGIQEYLNRIEPSSTEVDKRKSHRRTVEQALGVEFKGFNRVEVIGSHTRDTAVHVNSDVDYFAMLGIDDVTRAGSRVSSSTIVDRTRRALQARFRQTSISVDGVAVVVGFGQGQGAVDVVPGVWRGTTDTTPKYPVYEIPDGRGNWLRTSPQRHAKYLRDEDERSGYKLAKVIRLLKAWKYARSPRVPVLGFHMELLLAAERTCVGPRSYQNCLNDAFRLLADREGASLNDPLGISGRIPAAMTDAQRRAFTDAASYAAEKSGRALDAEVGGRVAEAFDYWKLVFNQEFPSR